MARRNTITTVIVVLLLLALAVGLMVGLSRVLGKNERETFGITVNGERYEYNAEGLVFGKTTEVTVTAPSGSYDVSIKSLAVSEDFEFLIGEEVYSWSNTVYQDFTSGFNVTENSDGFTITYEDLASVLSDALGYPKEDIIAGLCKSIVLNYLNNVGKGKKIVKPIIFQGGVSKNKGVVKYFKEILKEDIIVDENGHLMGALGVAILAKKNKIGKTYSLEMKDLKFITKAFECHRCSNNCELLKIYKNDTLVDSWGSKCGKY